MHNDRPTFFILNARLGWRGGAHPDADAIWGRDDGMFGLRLPIADAGGDAPLALTAADGSLGGLLMPRGMALDGELRLSLVILSAGAWRIRRYHPSRGSFETISNFAATIAADIDDADEATPLSLAALGTRLYLADAAAEAVHVFDLADGTRLPALPAPERDGWRPDDLFAHRDALYILDRGRRVYRYHPATNDPPQLVLRRRDDRPWRRLALDRAGRCYLLDPGDGARASLTVIDLPDSGGTRWRPVDLDPAAPPDSNRVTDANAVRHRFPPPPVRLWIEAGRPANEGCFCLPRDLAATYDRRLPTDAPPPDRPLALGGRADSDGAGGGRLFRRDGRPSARPAGLARSVPLYGDAAWWLSGPLDGAIHECQWHRIVIEFDDLPAGSAVEVSTLTVSSKSERDAITADLKANNPTSHEFAWATNFPITAPAQSPDGALRHPVREEILVQSRKGRFLYLRLRLAGDGFATPVVRSIRIEYPRQSYLDFLPAVFSADDESRWFFERFLSIFQASWDGLEHNLGTMARLFDPQAAPAGDFVRALAAWLAQPLDCALDDAGRRRLLESAPGRYPRRSTPATIRSYLGICLQNLNRLGAGDLMDLPKVVEGFRKRQRVLLSRGETGGLSDGASLWGPDVVGRLQIGVYATVGKARVIATGFPEADYFQSQANSFEVYVPACWLDNDEKRRLFRKAIDEEKPAHTQCHICLVEPGFRIAVQSTVGLDSIIGDYPQAGTRPDDPAAAPEPGEQLGRGSILGNGSAAPSAAMTAIPMH